MKHKHIFFIFVLLAAGIIAAAFWPFGAGWPFGEKKTQKQYRTRVIIPSAADAFNPNSESPENAAAHEDSYSLKAPLGDGEQAISLLNIDFDNDAIEEQVVAFRNSNNAESTIALTLFNYDERSKTYQRLWNIPAEVTMPGTVSLYTQDLLGDRSVCIIITGMNGQGEQTMTVIRKDPQEDKILPFAAIARIRISGSITVQELERPMVYHQGIARGQPFVITARGQDTESDNMLDRIEISYTFNPPRKIYEQSKRTRIRGSQIEERHLREILTGEPKAFEEFINDLWYHISPEGAVDREQYLYFDPVKREIVFFDNEIQQVFTWQRSNPTRYGLYISSQNISVTTLRRFLDIEMESLDRIRIRVSEDVRLRIDVNTSWDGSYHRAGSVMRASPKEKPFSPYTDAVYDSSLGRLRFSLNGEYELSSSGSLTKGRYAFFRAGSHELLELRPEQNSAQQGENRLIYRLAGMDQTGGSESLSLSRVRLGAAGIHDLHETPIILTKTP